MNGITLIVLCAGNSSRFSLKPKKQWLRIGDDPLWLSVTNQLLSYDNFDDIIITSHKNELNYMKNFSETFNFVAGGSTRQNSIKNALQKVTTSHVMITDVARACIPGEIIKELIKNKDKANSIVPVLDVSDTVIYNGVTIDRDNVKLIQTPQLSDTKTLLKSLETDKEFTDESSAIKESNGDIFYIKGSLDSSKITFDKDLKNLSCLQKPSQDFFTGFGIDTHQFENNKSMFLGGVALAVDYGFKAHSDGDVAIHSLIDALLGACGAGDIGEFFPDTDPAYKGADSKELLSTIVSFIHNVGYEIINIDLTILAETPKINPYKEQMKNKLATLLSLPKQKINIKATTSEKMGFIGRKEGVTVHSVATLKYYDWSK